MTYIVKRNLRQKNLRMHFNSKGQLIVSCPYFVSKEQLQTFVNSNGEWIKQQQEAIQERNCKAGQTIEFWGKTYVLRVEKSYKNKVFLSSETLSVQLPNPDDTEKIKRQLYLFYKKKLLEYATEKVACYATLMGCKLPEIIITNAKTTWGVCYAKKNLVKFSAMTASLEEDLIDMVIVHELCHLKYQDHSPKFWAMVGQYVNDLDNKKTRIRKISKTGLNRYLF